LVHLYGNKRIVEDTAFQFAILYFYKFHDSAHLQPMRKAALVAGIVRSQVGLALRLKGSNEIGDNRIGHMHLRWWIRNSSW
jgi:hypothetical protein